MIKFVKEKGGKKFLQYINGKDAMKKKISTYFFGDIPNHHDAHMFFKDLYEGIKCFAEHKVWYLMGTVRSLEISMALTDETKQNLVKTLFTDKKFDDSLNKMRRCAMWANRLAGFGERQSQIYALIMDEYRFKV